MKPRDYTVGWICAVQTEYVVACELLDEEHDGHDAPSFGSIPNDKAYTFGRIGEHNVVVACLPKGKYGIASAATVAKDMLCSFEAIRIGLMVGIGGGAPSAQHDIRLGDIVVGSPTGATGGVIHYDFGKAIQEKTFEHTGMLNAPPKVLLDALSEVSALHEREGHRIDETVSEMIKNNARLKAKYTRPAVEEDRLFEASYVHVERDQPCAKGCNSSMPPLIRREERGIDQDNPMVHYGLIASADKLMKDATARDSLIEQYNVLCFEMEAAGLMDSFPCLVIRGICDYSDTHKNDVWQGYAAAAAAAYAKGLLNEIPGRQVVDSGLASKEVERTIGSARSNANALLGVNVPKKAVTHFVARTKMSEEMDEWLLGDPKTASVVLLGAGGSGKTQLALDCCRRLEESASFTAVLWIDASSPTSVMQSYKVIAPKILKGLENSGDGEENMIIVQEALREQKGRWLIVFDNFDEPKSFEEHDIKYYIPNANNGSVLFTSRHAGSERLGHVVKVSGMSEEESLDLLLRWPASSEDERAQGVKIATELGHLALALDQAGAYIRARNLLLTEFMPHYRKRKKVIMEEIPDQWEYRRKVKNAEKETLLSIFTTWEMSFEQIEGSKVAKEGKEHFLTLAAFFDNKIISQRYFEVYYKSERPVWMQVFVTDDEWDEYALGDIVAECRKLSLLQVPEQQNSEVQFSIHPVVRDWLKLRRNKEVQQQFAGESITVLTSNVKEVDFNDLSLDMKQETVAHIDACIRNDGELLRELCDPLSQHRVHSALLFASCYLTEGRYNDAEELSKRALTSNKEKLGEKHLDTLETMENLAIVYRRKGRYDDAEELYKRALAGREEKLGAEHPDTLRTINNLAVVYRNKGRYDEDEELYKRALAGNEEKLGDKHPDTLGTVENLAIVYRDKGRYDEAEKLYKRALAGREEKLGLKHPDTLRTVGNLANVYRDKGQYDEAEELYKCALAGREEKLGEKHPDTLRTVFNLAIVYNNKGQYDEAEELYNRALAGREEKLGAKHPITLRTVESLAIVYSNKGRYDEAEKLYKRVLAGREEKLGGKHHDTLQTVHNLAFMYGMKGRYDEAEKLYKRALAGKEDKLGEKHPDTLQVIHNLAVTYGMKGRYDEAEKLYKRALAGKEEKLGEKHPDILLTVRDLVLLLEVQGRSGEADLLKARFVAIQ